ncbi:8-amino-7-oxononanoate synthase [Chitinimonas sp. BJYL2]|uniref:8-amino-7-oxononanoate synthase n=1 Tax=Chitinimonas sp. BJYL2 TaxID=2976696 RepID=UPI0022B2BC89|nr:8-amino-7-oxononanoate synthase [Chitinimonas sp. BJYL2]
MASEPDLLAELADQLHALDADHLRRRRRILSTAQGPQVTVGERTLRNFCSNDYLGLANDPILLAAAQDAMMQFGVGSGASHLVCGHQQAHEALEQRFAGFVGQPAALLFGTGYLANLGVIPALLGRGDAVFADKLNHASLNEACLLSRADFQRFPHNDCAALARQLAASKARRKLIAVDAVYSMDGDLAPLADLLQLAEQHNAWLYVDDAHGFGVLGEGRGSLAHWQLSSPRLIYLATLGKAAGSAGALVGAHSVVIEWLLNKAKPAIYTTASPALLAASAMAAIDIMEHEPGRRMRLVAHIARLRKGLADLGDALLPSQTPIQPLRMASSAAAMQVSESLWDAGCWVAAIRPPTVATPRLRITVSASHSDDDIDALIDNLKPLLA